MIVEHAYAKLNLTLEVIQKRADGYHDLATILQTVDLTTPWSSARVMGSSLSVPMLR